jgi:hypothetical protein
VTFCRSGYEGKFFNQLIMKKKINFALAIITFAVIVASCGYSSSEKSNGSQDTTAVDTTKVAPDTTSNDQDTTVNEQ